MEPIEVVLTEFYTKDNAKTNHTEQYDLVHNVETPTPILRRGCKFFFAIRFNRRFEEGNDVVRLSFGFGPRPAVTNGTRAILPLLVKVKELPENPGHWAACVTSFDGDTATLQIAIPANAPVGIWRCSIQSNVAGRRDQRRDHKVDKDIYVLFNPWCEFDGVYMDGEEDRREYVLNEEGKIWCGTYKSPKGKPWIYGQFDDIVLPSAVFLMEKARVAAADRGSPILVARAISAVINSLDDAGLLEGRWDGDYGDGTSPHDWTGSTAIMDEFLKSGGVPVKYGQCWVFSAVTVSVCRALGIPCRSTTNYISAHDTNCSLTVDKYFDIFGEQIENGPNGDCFDSCWNFHVWNDVWMARPDLPAGYGGWQIIDATPQEKSTNEAFCCGPASVEAVRKGEVGLLYDTPFVFSEGNADIVHFQEDPASDWGFSRLAVNEYHVGRKIVTKKRNHLDLEGDSDLWDVTLLYKNPEGTEAERLAVYNAAKGVPKASEYYQIPADIVRDVAFDLVDIDTIPFGQSFDVVVKIESRSEETRNISAVLSAHSIFYTGSNANALKKAQGSFALKPGEKETLRIRVTPQEYLDKLVDHGIIKIYAIANVQETKQTWSEEDDFTLSKPEMTVDVGGVRKVGEVCVVNFSFKNPLNVPLTRCSYNVEGPGLMKPRVVSYRDVQPKELVSISESFIGKRVGPRQVVANFNSHQIQGISGSVHVTIEE